MQIRSRTQEELMLYCRHGLKADARGFKVTSHRGVPQDMNPKAVPSAAAEVRIWPPHHPHNVLNKIASDLCRCQERC